MYRPVFLARGFDTYLFMFSLNKTLFSLSGFPEAHKRSVSNVTSGAPILSARGASLA